jgi:hypothetical protein
MSTAKQTHNREEIQAWAESNGGVPAIVKNTEKNNHNGGILRIHFPSHSSQDEKFEQIDWDRFFEELESNKLDVLYQEKKADGEDSTFHKFVERN